MISARQIDKYLSGRKILDNVCIDVPKGQITVLLGRNGAGKSTLLKCLALIDPPDSGELAINGSIYRFPQTTQPVPCPWPQLTALFQGLHLWPHMTIHQNIVGPLQWQNGLTYDEQLFERIVADFELTSVLERLPSECSGGQRQRAAVARALVLKPEYLLLDEPTASADVEHAHVLGQYLREFSAAGAAVLVITHMLGFARTIADRVVFMEAGAVAEAGGPEILSSPSHDTLQRFVALH